MAERHAILIGIDGYSFRPLASAVNDAVAMRDALLGRGTLALSPIFAENEFSLLTTPAVDKPAPADSVPATRESILSTLRPHYDNADPAAFLLVFFAGHGVVVSEDGRIRKTLILPSDVTGPKDGRNMICLDELLNLFKERGPHQQLWVIDACRDMPYEQRPRGYEIEWEEQKPQGTRAQIAIFAVAQGGTALSEVGGQGRFTGHLLNGLAGHGSAADYVPGRGHCVTAQSLHAYAQRRVAKLLEGYDDWTRAVQTPQIVSSGSALDPLRDLPSPPPSRFAVTVLPAEAESVVKVALEVQMGIPVPDWPPTAPPRIYELRTSLRQGMERLGWGDPKPRVRAVDLREEDTATIEVPRRSKQPETDAPAQVSVTTGERGIARAETSSQQINRAFGAPPGLSPAVLIVAAADVVARVRLRRAEAPWDEIEEAPNTPVQLKPGPWDVMVMVGDEMISATRVVLYQGERRTVQAVAQITPATAALLPPTSAVEPDRATPTTVIPSETIGPMQGAILATLLPLLALKPYDTNHLILGQFDHLGIPFLEGASAHEGDAALAVAVALEGIPRPEALVTVRSAQSVWRGGDGRVMLFSGWKRDPLGTITIEISGRVLNVAAPPIRGGVTVVTATFWPDGRQDVSVGIFRLPIGQAWGSDQPAMPAGRIARALAFAAPLFRAGTNLADTPDSVLTEIAYAKWADPVLGALAFHARDYQLNAEARPINDGYVRDKRETIRGNLRNHFPNLPDSRVIAALDFDVETRRSALRALLEDDELGQPVLTASLVHLARAATEAGWEDHWTVNRLDRISPGQVFNAIRTQTGANLYA
jgi:hypothetical protein